MARSGSSWPTPRSSLVARADRAGRLELERFLAGFEQDGRTYYDLEGLAVYKLEPTPRTAILCRACRYISLVPSVPRRRLVHECPRCAAAQRLTPPLEVLAVRPAAVPRLM